MTKTTKWLLVILTIVIILSGAYITWQKMIPKAKPLPVAVISPTPSSLATNISTADWKTYRNELYGITFKYPADWEMTVGKFGPQNFINFQSSETKRSIEKNTIIPGYSNDLTISYYKNTTLEDYLSHLDIWQIQQLAIDGKMASIVDIAGAFSNIGVVIYNNGIYELSFETNSKKELTDVEKQIISTFQFTDSIVSVDGQKKYTNSQHGFSLQFPSDWALVKPDPGYSDEVELIMYITNIKGDGYLSVGEANIGVIFKENQSANDLIRIDSSSKLKDGDTAEKSQTEVNKETIPTYSITSNKPFEGMPSKNVNYYFGKGSDTFVLSLTYPLEGSEMVKETTENIISTFQFTK